MQYPNNYRNNLGWSNVRTFGIPAYVWHKPSSGERYNIFTNWNVKSSVPEGYAMRGCLVHPIKTGWMSAYKRNEITFSGTGNVLQGGPLIGSFSFSFTGTDIVLNLNVNLSGTSTITLTGNNMVLRLVVGLDGSGNFELSGDGNVLALIVPFDGIGYFEITGVSDLRGKLSLVGEWTPYTELSPENLARSVWEALASAYDTSGTMGEKLNAAGSAGDPLTGVIETGMTLREATQIMLSILAGKTTITDNGDDTATVKFRDSNDTLDRVTAEMSGSERTNMIYDI